MRTFQLSDLTEAQLLEVISLNEKGVSDYPWLDVSEIVISSEEQSAIDIIKTRLQTGETMLMNEATIWARGIYPLLVLAERGQIQAWAEVALVSNFSDVKLTGTADGVLAKVVGGIVRMPYLVILEAKRSIEAKNPRIQFLDNFWLQPNVIGKHSLTQPQMESPKFLVVIRLAMSGLLPVLQFKD